jgi:hypothetical protein
MAGEPVGESAKQKGRKTGRTILVNGGTADSCKLDRILE